MLENISTFRTVLCKANLPHIAMKVLPRITVTGYLLYRDIFTKSLNPPLNENDSFRTDMLAFVKEKSLGTIDLSFSSKSNFSEGSSFFKNSYKHININEKLKTKDRYAAGFVFKHELGHLKENHAVLFNLVSSVLAVTASFFCTTWYMPLILDQITCLFVNITLMKKCEESADTFAFENSSKEELAGAARMFSSLERKDEKIRKKIPLIIRVLLDVKAVFDCHPSHQKRLDNVKKVFSRRFPGDDLNELSKKTKPAKFKTHLDFNKETIESTT